MPLYKNLAGQKITFPVINAITGAHITTDDSANLSCQIMIDGAAGVAGGGAFADVLTSAAAEQGVFSYAPSAAETNGNFIHFYIKSATANYVIDDIAILTKPEIRLKRATAFANFTFPMYLTGTGTLASGVVVTGTISKDGGAYAGIAGAIAETGVSGTYTVDFSAAELTAEVVGLIFTAAGCDPTVLTITLHQN